MPSAQNRYLQILEKKINFNLISWQKKLSYFWNRPKDQVAKPKNSPRVQHSK